jgi:hypothetical protein
MIASAGLSARLHAFPPGCGAEHAVRTTFSISYMLIVPFAAMKTLAGLSTRLLIRIDPSLMQLSNWFIFPGRVLPS